ncbi:MAG: hypothetical protein WCL33_01465 [Planctomycetota bacterium]
MSVKKPNTLEMHCEKILVLFAGILCVAVLAWQFLFYGIEVKIGNSTVSLAQLNEKLSKVDSSVTAKLDPASISPLEIPAKKRVANDSDIFRERLSSDLTPNLLLPANEPSFGSLLMGKAIENEQVFYNPVFAAAQMKESILSIDALDLSAIDKDLESENVGFFSKYKAPATTDIIWVSPCAEVNLAAMRIELERNDLKQTPPIEPIPNQWFDPAPFILDVVFERQQKGAGNTWGPATIVKPVPGQGAWREMIETGKGGQGIRDTVFSELASYAAQMSVLQPEMLPTKNQSFPPKSFSAQTETDSQFTKAEQEKKLAEKKLNSVVLQLNRIEENLKIAGGPLYPQKGSSGGSDKDDADGKKEKGGGGNGFGMGGGGSVKKGAPTGSETQASKDNRISLTKKRDQKKKELEKLKSEFEVQFPNSIQDSKNLAKQEPKLQLADLPVVNVWAHDLDAVAGNTYRYRATVKIYNPFFTRENLLVASQTKLSKGLVISSATSEWGAEVTLPSATSFFFTRGSARDGIGGRRISIALFRNSSGVQNLSSEDLKLGDPVGGLHGEKESTIDFSTNWYLADIFDDAGSDKNGGIIAVFQQRTNAGEVLQEFRSIEGDSENFMKFKAQLPATQPKKVATKAPKA